MINQYLTDGALDFAGGVDSGKVTLLQSPINPNGLRRDQVAWAQNATMRGGSITQRAGWRKLTRIHAGGALYQGGYLYEPRSTVPALVTSIGGRIYRTVTEADGSTIDLSTASGLTNPADVDQAFFAQGEEFLIIQAGDYGLVPAPTLPLFYDGHTMRRSVGILGVGDPGNEIPAARAMDYYQQRLWYAQVRTTSAGDIVLGPSGTIAYGYRDSILKVTENPLAISGDGFSVPTEAGDIRALAHAAAIDTALGQSQLFIFTRKVVYALSVPVTRAEWTSTTEPMQKLVQKRYGTSADRSIVAANGDLFYQTLEPGIRTLALAVREFTQWGNTPISKNINRVLRFNDRSLSRFGTGILYDNRMLQSSLPVATPVGVAHQAVSVLDFDLISSFQDKLRNAPLPAWEGINQGLDILQLFTGDYGGRERAFAVVHSRVDGGIDLWEITLEDRFENGDADLRIEWFFETPSFPFNNPFELKELMAGDLWIDREYGKVTITVEYRGDDDPCWHDWAKFERCFARTSCEDVVNPICYPLETYREGNDKPLTLPHPNPKECMSNRSRPAMHAHAFQVRVTIKGFCRFRGILLYAMPVGRPLYAGLVC